MLKIPGMDSMQIHVLHSKYGPCDYFLPTKITDWLYGQDIIHYGYVGGNVNGLGEATRESVYMVYNIRPEDVTAFKIQFPDIKTSIHRQDFVF